MNPVLTVLELQVVMKCPFEYSLNAIQTKELKNWSSPNTDAHRARANNVT